MRSASFLSGLVAALAVLTAGCGGGGDGDDNGNGNGGEPAPPLPQVVRFGVGQPDNRSLTIAATVDGQPVAVTVRGLNAGGSYDTVNRSRTLDNGVSYQLETGDLYGALAVQATAPWSWPGNTNAGSGALRVQRGADVIAVTVQPNLAGGGGVLVEFTPQGGAPQSQTATWDQFEDMTLNPAAAEYLQIAALAYTLQNFVFERVVDVTRHLKLIAARETDLQHAGSGQSVTDQGDLLPLLSARGSEALAWTDNGDPFGEVGPADVFAATFSNLWRNDPTSDSDPLFVSGTLRLQNYVEGRTPVVLGFQDVAYENVVIRETLEEQPGTFSFGLTTTVNGSFNAIFTAQ